MTKKALIIALFFTLQLFSQVTNIPDADFERLLVLQGIDSDNTVNGQVLTADISGVTHLSIYNDYNNNIRIQDVTGIEDFTALTYLSIVNNALQSVDLSNNIHIDTLNVEGLFNLQSINISNNHALKFLRFYQNGYNNPISLDVSHNTALEYLNCMSSNIYSLDVSNNTLLKELIAGNITYFSDNRTTFNYINSIDLSNNINLELLVLENCELSSIVLPVNNQLKEIYLRAQQISSFSTDNLNHLETLNLAYNQQLSNLDLSGATVLKTLNLNRCNFTGLPFSSNSLESFYYEFYPHDDILNNYHKNSIDSLDFSNFPNLRILMIEDSNLQYINISNNPLLEYLLLSDNQNLSSIDLSNNTLLRSLNMSKCNLQSIDLSNNVNLGFLLLGENTIYEYNYLYHNNNIANIDLSNNVNLKDLGLRKIGLTTLDISQNTLLETLVISNNNLSNINLDNNSLLKHIACNNNPIVSIDLSHQQALETVQAKDNSLLSSLNLNNNHNASISSARLNNNPSLHCITVDNPANANAHIGVYANWQIDNQVSFSNDCTSSITDKSINEYEVQINQDSKLIEIKSTSKIVELVLMDLTGRVLLKNKNHNKISFSTIKNKIILLKIIDGRQNVTCKKIALAY
jgi:hypothetical protein